MFSIKRISIILFGVVGAIIIYCTYPYIFKEYLIFFKKSGTITHHNNNGKLNGKSIVIANGILASEANFIGGKKEGWAIDFYKSGALMHKEFFRNNKLNGPMYAYYQSGKLKWACNAKDGKRFGSLYWYFENGRLDSYATYDIKGESFSLFQYDELGKIIKMEGYVVSPDIYSRNTSDSVIMLDFNLDKKEGYHDIRNLYINVATPPDLHMQVIVNVNDHHFKDLPIKDNLVMVPDVFTKKGEYKILIESHLFDKNNKIVNGINVSRVIKIE